MTKRAIHNALFVAIITNNRALITELLVCLLPPEQLAKLDLRTLKFEATVFTDAEGNERRTDAVVSVLTKDGKRVVFLIEHKSSQDKGLFGQLLAYQALLETHLADKVITIVISNAKGRWRLPRRFRDKFANSADAVGGDVALDFGYLLFHMPDYSQEEIIKIFPKSHPYMLSLHCVRELSHDKVAKFFHSTLILEIEERKRLLELATDCFSKFNSDFSLAVLKDIEVEAIKKLKDRLMNKLKIGREGWLEEGEQAGVIKGRQERSKEIALRMLEKGMSVTEICSITKLSRNAVNKLERENSEPRKARKRA